MKCGVGADPRIPPTQKSKQILDFSLFPKVNEAFAKPVSFANMSEEHLNAEIATQQLAFPDDIDSDSEQSVMDITNIFRLFFSELQF